MSDYTLSAKITGDASGFSSAMDQAQAKINQTSGKLAEFGNKMKNVGGVMQGAGAKMSVGLTLPIALAGKAMITAASDYQENLNKVNVAFGKSGKAVTEWSDNALKQFGLSKNQAMSATSLFGDMATSIGLTQPAAAGMSTSLAGLAGDMASFKNVSADQAMNALNGVFTGETESLKGLGVMMNETTLSAFALANGFKKPIKEMTQAEKVQLRYAFVMDATKNAQGDYANTADGTANSVRNFKGTLENLSIAMGEKLLPIFTPLVQKATDLITKFSEMSPKTQGLIMGFAGILAAAGPLLMILGTATRGLGTLSLIGAKLIPMLGGTGTGVKALGLAMRAFMGPLLPLIIGITALVAVFKYLWNTNEQFRNSMKLTMSQIVAAVMPVFQQLKVVFGQVAKAIGPIAVQIAQMVGKILVKVAPLVVFFAKVFAAVLGTVITVFTKIYNKISGVFKNIKSAWGGLKSFVSGVFSGIAGAVGTLVGAVKGFVNGVIGGVNSAIGIINKIPGVEIGLIPKLAVGTQNWGGGPAMVHEQGGEIINLPKGSQVIPHDLSKRAINKTKSIKGTVDMDILADRIASAMRKVTIRNITTLNGKVISDVISPMINKNLGTAQKLAKRGV